MIIISWVTTWLPSCITALIDQNRYPHYNINREVLLMMVPWCYKGCFKMSDNISPRYFLSCCQSVGRVCMMRGDHVSYERWDDTKNPIDYPVCTVSRAGEAAVSALARSQWQMLSGERRNIHHTSLPQSPSQEKWTLI